MQIKIPRKISRPNDKPVYIMQWVSVKPSKSDKPYEYKTETEAYDMLKMCYGACYDLPQRVIRRHIE